MSGIIVHEWLEQHGGAENVVEAMQQAFPDADLWALWDNSRGRFNASFETLLARTPLRRAKALALPFMPIVWRRLPAMNPDWILVSSHLFAHHARLRGAEDVPKLVYAHTPARYIWTPELDLRGGGLTARSASRILKPLDRRRAQEAAAIAANSKFIAQRIAHAWEREAEVIYPPIDVDRFAAEPTLVGRDRERLARVPEGFVLAVSRWVPYKRLDMAIRVGALSDLPVVIAGRGPDEHRLRKLAIDSRVRVEFIESPSDELLQALLHRAAALVFAPVEDFGIVPVEAMAAGTPAIANAIGGAAESVLDGQTGSLVNEWASDEDVRRATAVALEASPEACRARAGDFSSGRFDREIRQFVERHAT